MLLMRNYVVAGTQHITDALNKIDRRQTLLAEQATNLTTTNTLVQQAFVTIDARQAAQHLSFTIIIPTEYTSGGQSGGGNPPRPPPAAGAVRMITDALPTPNSETTYIGTPGRGRNERAPRGERSRSTSMPRGRKKGVQRPLLDIQVTAPIEQTIPAIKNIGLEEVRIKREASIARSASEPRPVAKRGRPKTKAAPQLMITDAEPAKKREADGILGSAAKKKFIEKEEEVKAPPPIKSKEAAPPQDSSAASEASTAAPKAKAKGRPKKEIRDTSAAPISK